MQKVRFFKSVQVKLVLIYVLLILIAMQIIGLYFAKELEQNLKKSFETSVTDRLTLVNFSVKEELLKERTDSDPTLEQSLKSIVDLSSDDIKEIRVIDPRYRILASSDKSNQSIVGQREMDSLVRQSITTQTRYAKIALDEKTRKRIWVVATPIMSNGKANGKEIGTVYVKANIERIFEQMNDINQILAAGTALALAITIVLGIFIARTITKPISDMRRQAQAMARGNFSRKVKVYGNDEIGQLAIAFNHLTNRLQEAQSTTEGERRKLASILTNMTDGVIATDRKGKIILINSPAEKLLNSGHNELMGRPLVSVLGLEKQHTFEDLIHMKDAINLDFSSSERPYIWRANFSVIQKETGFVNGLITVLHDITEQEKIDMERREFVSNVSHELRTPLTTMRSYLEALTEGAWQNKEIAPHFLHVTQTETERMIRLVTDLLQLSHMDSREYEINADIVDFNRFFNSIIDRFEMAKSKNVEFIRLLPSVSYYVEIDTDKITQVIDNIISNALKYSPDGGNIRFGMKANDGILTVMISDDGMGIPKDNVDRIFDRFYRVDRARARSMGGTGLGLAISREMIVAHGGKIWAESEEGVGTTIFFTLPYEEDEAGEWD
ncbi:cell wall metabolism sensor histidine kinase WalK [Rummeliibacillus sp. G93]|uniref:histidine kinase n=1 Tax=Rummeliibacillus stabekisii TaxID=241244 RepID=A0A143HFU2_9BACL|nr:MULTISPECIES: cell wall metabolism sensor histidine kinase WalK [Rummeliibacillus]AMX00608.1 PAS domain-containing sensor histidine kinase [Rummeliibacillus stabekisii]MBB5171153.1 two-component system sensor histidine kinase VicK [Rummeliibacillus stabekisii]UQW97447.1 cell wall metabolism sensor histidine kinase WalK [Rummeliibacillus sp. G93]GEL06142.1 PAS domain-containing sensor histidine kinase [Rummeliibacillus stabekisii]